MSEFTYASCDTRMRVRMHKYNGEDWCCVLSADNHPERWFRMHDSRASNALIQKYAYMDAAGCVNKSTGHLKGNRPLVLHTNGTLDKLDDRQRATIGVPQRTPNSGLCWYCAMCFTMLFSSQMRDVIMHYAPESFKRMCANVLVDRAAAEAFRRYLYDTFALGDRPGQNPELDGQNGFSQFCILAARIGLPVVRLFAPSMIELTDPVIDQSGDAWMLRTDARPDEPSLLVVRCFRTKWVPHRRVIHKGRRYKLVALMIGSEHCGHQIGASTCELSTGRWSLSDSDMAQHGIGPMFWKILRRPGESRFAFRRRWRDMWDKIMPVTIFGDGHMCDLNPTNRPTHELEQHAQRLKQPAPPGVVNTDWIYLNA